nr:MAG TPA: hypothetical protein [Caudoviricetes sp.]
MGQIRKLEKKFYLSTFLLINKRKNCIIDYVIKGLQETIFLILEVLKMGKVVKDGWYESKSLGCDFKVENGIIIHATGISHDLPKYAYNSSRYIFINGAKIKR